MRFPRGQALPEVSTSACLISDLHHKHSSSLPLFPLLCLLVPAARRQADVISRGAWAWQLVSPQRGTQKNLPMISWHDKLSRLIICLNLMVWQLIKALQGCIFCPIPPFSVKIQSALRGLRWGAEHDQTGTIKEQSRYKLTFMTEHALVSLARTRQEGKVFPPPSCNFTLLCASA